MQAFASIFFILSAVLSAFGRPDAPIELGGVKWHRSLDEAIRLATEQDKLILILFQEVPG